MDKDELIAQLNAVRSSLGTISIISTRQNMNALLGSMQALDQAIAALQQIGFAEKQVDKEESDNERNEG